MLRSLIIKLLVRGINFFQLPSGGGDRTPAKNKKNTAESYNEAPMMSVCLQFFNKRENIELIWKNLTKCGADEIIIQEDGSSDGSLSKWASLAIGKNHFVIRSNDLFEVRTYDRSIDYARGKYVALLQDDDIPPPSSRWVDEAIYLFEKFDDLAIIGGLSGASLLTLGGSKQVTDESRYSVVDDIAEYPGVFRYRIKKEPEKLVDGIQFEFSEYVNRAPMFVRKSFFKELGGIDQSFAPFQCDDVDLCLKAWQAGYKVGLVKSPFARNVGIGGMRLYNRNAPNIVENWKRIYAKYGVLIDEGYFSDKVSDANRRLTSNLQ